MKWRHILRPLALAAALPLIALSALAVWRSLERLYAAYLISHGRLFSDDLTQGRINLRLEIETWCLVLGMCAGAFLLLRFWYHSKFAQ
jgi:hypothetical protein